MLNSSNADERSVATMSHQGTKAGYQIIYPLISDTPVSGFV